MSRDEDNPVKISDNIFRRLAEAFTQIKVATNDLDKLLESQSGKRKAAETNKSNYESLNWPSSNRLYTFIKAHTALALKDALNVLLNDHLRLQLADFDDRESYARKQFLAKAITQFIKRHSLTIKHSTRGVSCTIYAIASRDGMGRYTFENRTDKKRFGHHKSLAEIIPLTCELARPSDGGILTWEGIIHNPDAMLDQLYLSWSDFLEGEKLDDGND